MNKKFKSLANKTHFTLYDSKIWQPKVHEYSSAIVNDCIDLLKDLRGYSGVGEDGDPYDTSSWNAALTAVEKMLIIRFELTDFKDQNERL